MTAEEPFFLVRGEICIHYYSNHYIRVDDLQEVVVRRRPKRMNATTTQREIILQQFEMRRSLDEKWDFIDHMRDYFDERLFQLILDLAEIERAVKASTSYQIDPA